MAAGQRHRVTRPAVVAQFTRFWQVDIQQELALSVLCERQIEESLRCRFAWDYRFLRMVSQNDPLNATEISKLSTAGSSLFVSGMAKSMWATRANADLLEPRRSPIPKAVVALFNAEHKAAIPEPVQ